MHILIVDEKATACRTIRQILTHFGYSNVEEVGDGKAALAYLEKNPVDLLFTGWSMPGMTGLELTALLRTRPEQAALPVFLFTLRNRKEDVIEAIESGVTAYLLKPVTPERVEARIDQARLHAARLASGRSCEPAKPVA